MVDDLVKIICEKANDMCILRINPSNIRKVMNISHGDSTIVIDYNSNILYLDPVHNPSIERGFIKKIFLHYYGNESNRYEELDRYLETNKENIMFIQEYLRGRFKERS